MMPANQWIMLWIIFLSYVLLGAFVFYLIESKHEESRRMEDPSKLNVEGNLMIFLLTFITFSDNGLDFILISRVLRSP